MLKMLSYKLFLLFGILLLSSCSVHTLSPHTEPLDRAPEVFSQKGTVKPLDLWWKAFDDTSLDVLMREALANNLSLKAAWARLEQAEALARKTGASLIPSLELEGSAQRTRNILAGRTSTNNMYSLGLNLSYEIDLWKRITSLENAATLDAVAARESTDSLAIILSSAVANTWYETLEQKTQLRLLQEQLKLSRTFLELVELRFAQGQVSAVDVYQQREQVAATETQIPIMESALETSSHRLAVLLGRDPRNTPCVGIESSSETKPQDTKPQTALDVISGHVGKLPELGIPADLLQHRPDLRAAHARVKAADFRIAAAIADRLPTLRIGAKAGTQDSDSTELFKDWIWSLAGGLIGPIVDGGRRSAEVDRTKAALKESLALYEETFLTALQEVEDALSQEGHQREFLRRLKRQLGFAKAALEESHQRYAAGLEPYLSVLTALRSVQLLERNYVQAQRLFISHRISLHKALGGSWASAVTPDGLNTTVSQQQGNIL